MKFTILTLFPNIFDSYLNESILKRAQENKKISIETIDIRKYTHDKHHTADDKPYGGGAGMVLMAGPILKAVESVNPDVLRSRGSDRKRRRRKVVVFSAKGKPFNQKIAYDWARKYSELIFIAGRYEGIDERVVKALKAEEISIGPYVLTDGDVAAMVVISAVARLVPGVIRLESLAEESHWNLILKKEASGTLGAHGLEYPHYTRPETLKYKGKKYVVPKVLLSGDHEKIAEWRKKHSAL